MFFRHDSQDALADWVQSEEFQSVASLWGGEGRTAPCDTLQGVTPEGKIFVGKFIKNSGEMRSDR